MTVGDLIRSTLADLDPDERQAVAGVVLRLASRPGPGDVARGCGPAFRGYFWGSTPARDDGRVGHILPESDEPAPATGEIVLFLENLSPLTPRRLGVVLRHELAHALGYDEEEVELVQGLVLEERAA